MVPAAGVLGFDSSSFPRCAGAFFVVLMVACVNSVVPYIDDVEIFPSGYTSAAFPALADTEYSILTVDR
jgi:hypothetical protein